MFRLKFFEGGTTEVVRWDGWASDAVASSTGTWTPKRRYGAAS